MIIMDETQSEVHLNISEWSSDTTYLIALLSWTLGLINIFQTPQILSTENAWYYMITYIPLAMIIGIPLTFMELGISQFSRTSNISWNLCPLFRGIGYSKITLALIFQIYYNVLNSYVFLYLITSLSTTVKWARCDPSWANSSCYDFQEDRWTKNDSGYQTSVEQFWYNKVLVIQETTEKFDWPQWELVAYLSVTMFIVFLANSRGTRSLEKFLSVTMLLSTFEFIIVFFVATITPGSLNGFAYLFRINWRLNQLLPWKESSIVLKSYQDILYSMGIGLGGLSSLGAQSSFRKPIHKYAILCNMANIATLVMFMIITLNFYGILSYRRKTDIHQIVHPPTKFSNNIFTVIPGALLYLPGPAQLWIFLFYSSIFLKGISSSAVMMSSILQVIYEYRPNFMKKSILFSFICSILICISGSIMHTTLGISFGTYLNELIYTTLLPLINTLQIIVVIYFYGLVRFIDDLHFMLGFRPSAFWQLGMVVSSVLLPILTIFSIIKFFKSTSNYKSDIITIFERCTLSITLFWIPFMIMVWVIRRGFKKSLDSSEDWGPHNTILKKSREVFTGMNITSEHIYQTNLLKNKLARYGVRLIKQK